MVPIGGSRVPTELQKEALARTMSYLTNGHKELSSSVYGALDKGLNSC